MFGIYIFKNNIPNNDRCKVGALRCCCMLKSRIIDTALVGYEAVTACILLSRFGSSGRFFSLVSLQHSNCFFNLSLQRLL